jgi:hypothetical protein
MAHGLFLLQLDHSLRSTMTTARSPSSSNVTIALKPASIFSSLPVGDLLGKLFHGRLGLPANDHFRRAKADHHRPLVR